MNDDDDDNAEGGDEEEDGSNECEGALKIPDFIPITCAVAG